MRLGRLRRERSLLAIANKDGLGVNAVWSAVLIFAVWTFNIVFGAVMSDAAMLDAVLELDVWGKERVEGGHRVGTIICFI